MTSCWLWVNASECGPDWRLYAMRQFTVGFQRFLTNMRFYSCRHWFCITAVGRVTLGFSESSFYIRHQPISGQRILRKRFIGVQELQRQTLANKNASCAFSLRSNNFTVSRRQVSVTFAAINRISKVIANTGGIGFVFPAADFWRVAFQKAVYQASINQMGKAANDRYRKSEMRKGRSGKDAERKIKTNIYKAFLEAFRHTLISERLEKWIQWPRLRSDLPIWVANTWRDSNLSRKPRERQKSRLWHPSKRVFIYYFSFVVANTNFRSG